MIFTLLFKLGLLILTTVINFLPAASARDTAILTAISSAISDFHTNLAAWNWLFPLDLITNFAIATTVIIFGYFTFNLALRIFRG